MKRNHGLNNNTNPTKISNINTNTQKSSSAKVRKSHSSPTNQPVVPLTDPSSIPTNHSEFPNTDIPIPASPNKKKSHPNRLNNNTSTNIQNHHSLPFALSSTTTSTHERPHLRMSASSRFGKNLLPTWLGGHSTEEENASVPSIPSPNATTPTSPSSSSNEDLDSAELNSTFETLLVCKIT